MNESRMWVVLLLCAAAAFLLPGDARGAQFAFPFTEGGGTFLDEGQTPAYFSTYYAYTDDDADINIAAAIFKDLQLTESDAGKTFVIYAFENYPGFVTFVDNLTDGRDNRFQKACTFSGIGGSAEVGNESSFFGDKTQNNIDFAGYLVNNIALQVYELTIDAKDNWVDYHISGKIIFDADIIDADEDGVADEKEVAGFIDLDGDGADDTVQQNMRCLHTETGEVTLSVKIPPEARSFGLIRTLPAAEVDASGNIPADFPLGLISFRLEVAKGATVELPIYFSQPLPQNSRWYKYSPAAGWYDYTENADFDAGGKRVTLTLTDGGEGDLDGRTNTIIIDPSGPAGGDVNTGGGSSGCFIRSLHSF